MKDTFQPLLEDDVLSALYQGQLDKIPFRRFLYTLKQRLNLVMVSLDIGIGKNNIPPVSLICYPDKINDQMALFKANQAFWHLYPRKESVQAGDIYRLNEIVPVNWKENSYYRKYMLPLGVISEWVMAVSGPDNIMCLLRLGIDEKMEFDDSHKRFLQQLRPHLEESLALHMHIRRPSSIVTLLDTMSDSLGMGFFILNGHREVIRSNNVAKYIAQYESYLSLVGNQLRFSQSASAHYNKMFSRFIDEAMRWREKQYDRYVTLGEEQYEIEKENSPVPSNILRIERENEMPVDILVQALRPYIFYRNETSAQIVVYIVSHRCSFSIPEQVLTKLYDLTSSEAQLAKLLVNGYSITDAAKCLGLTNDSARTYSKRIYSKTGVHRQAELVRLLLSSVARFAD